MPAARTTDNSLPLGRLRVLAAALCMLPVLAAEGRTVAAPKWPTTLADLEARGLRPFPAEFRGKDCYFVFGRGE